MRSRCRRTEPRHTIGGAALTALAAVGCAAHPGSGALEVWSHAGQASERRVLSEQVARFDAAHPEISVRLTFLPEGSYTGQVQASAVAGDLPDLLELDGPFVADAAWQGSLRPLDGRLDPALVADLLPSVVAEGTWAGHLWAVGAFDSGLAIWARRSALTAAGVRIPRGPEDAWSGDELDAALDALARRDPDGAVLDLKLNYRDEWFTYGFSPLLVSAGGGLLDPGPPTHAGGVLDGDASVAALERVQRWIASGRVDPNLDDLAFVAGRVALSWVGHWEAPRYEKAWGDDLVLVPLPDLGHGTRTGQGSWVWTVPASSRRPDDAVALLEYLLDPEQVRATVAANGAVPARRSAIRPADPWAAGGRLHLYLEQLEGGFAVPRPRTPAYPTVTGAFAAAFLAIRDGADVRRTLSRAAAAIDRDVADNRGYPIPERLGRHWEQAW